MEHLFICLYDGIIILPIGPGGPVAFPGGPTGPYTHTQINVHSFKCNYCKDGNFRGVDSDYLESISWACFTKFIEMVLSYFSSVNYSEL